MMSKVKGQLTDLKLKLKPVVCLERLIQSQILSYTHKTKTAARSTRNSTRGRAEESFLTRFLKDPKVKKKLLNFRIFLTRIDEIKKTVSLSKCIGIETPESVETETGTQIRLRRRVKKHLGCTGSCLGCPGQGSHTHESEKEDEVEDGDYNPPSPGQEEDDDEEWHSPKINPRGHRPLGRPRTRVRPLIRPSRAKKIFKNAQRWSCRWCGKKFCKAYSRNCHETNQHDPVTHVLKTLSDTRRNPTCWCDGCGAKFGAWESLKKHKCKDKGVKRQPFPGIIFEEEIPLAEEILGVEEVDVDPFQDLTEIATVVNNKGSTDTAQIVHVDLVDIVGEVKAMDPVPVQGVPVPFFTLKEEQSLPLKTETLESSVKNEDEVGIDISDVFLGTNQNQNDDNESSQNDNRVKAETAWMSTTLFTQAEGSGQKNGNFQVRTAIATTGRPFQVRLPIDSTKTYGRSQNFNNTRQYPPGKRRPRPGKPGRPRINPEDEDEFEEIEEGGPFPCNICDSVFDSKYKLKVHSKTHGVEKPFLCEFPMCGKNFRSMHNLRSHEQIHTAYAPHKCLECGAAYRQKHGLRAHMTKHTGILPYQCTQCPQKFSSYTGRHHHFQRKHQDKSFVCEYCERTFSLKQHLTLHLRSHTGEKPLKCTFCNKAFARTNTKRRHELKHMRLTGDYYQRMDSVQSLKDPPISVTQ